LEQPWETAVRQSAIKDPVTVITKDESAVQRAENLKQELNSRDGDADN
jgi:hypothetical protein